MADKVIHLVALEREKRSVLPTSETARHLGRAQQTLHVWAASANPPIQPLRIRGRLAWPVADIRRLLGVTAEIAA